MPALHVSNNTLLPYVDAKPRKSPTGDIKGHAFVMFRVFEARLDVKHGEIGLSAAVVVDVRVLGEIVVGPLATETTFIKC